MSALTISVMVFIMALASAAPEMRKTRERTNRHDRTRSALLHARHGKQPQELYLSESQRSEIEAAEADGAEDEKYSGARHTFSSFLSPWQ